MYSQNSITKYMDFCSIFSRFNILLLVLVDKYSILSNIIIKTRDIASHINRESCTIAQFYCIHTFVFFISSKLQCNHTKPICSITKLFYSPSPCLCSPADEMLTPSTTFSSQQRKISFRAPPPHHSNT